MSRFFLAAAFAACVVPAYALDYQVHGFASQGYVWSTGNDVMGHSRGDGEFQYYEIGVNGAVDFGHGLLLSGQEVVRRVGATAHGDLRLDFAQLDYRYWASEQGSAGVRIGKVKIPYGFYNDTRDVVFNRPSILLPDSVYSDTSDQERDLLFSSKGGQLYGDLRLGGNDVSLSAGWMLRGDLDDEQRRTLIDLPGIPYNAEFDRFWHARLMDDIGGRWQVALSHFFIRFNIQSTPASPGNVTVRADIDNYVLSLRYTGEPVTVTFEYAPQRQKQWIDFAGTPVNSSGWGDGAYLQGEYRFRPDWTALLRFDAQFADTHHRNGSTCLPSYGVPDYGCYAYTGTVGLNWQPTEHWGVWAEYNLIDGTFNKYSILDNYGVNGAKHWASALVMIGYRF